MPKSLKAIFQRKAENAEALLKVPSIYRKLRGSRRLFFFFPFWQIGGGERVHADILKAFQKDDPLCFITDDSENDGFKKDFKTYADTIELGRWSKKKSWSAIMLKKIAAFINAQENPVAFGCHSHFFYELIPYLAPHVKVADLIHAFTFDPNGPEIYSLPEVKRLDHRVILGENTRNDFRKLYGEKGIDSDYLEKFTIIPNKSDIPPYAPSKDYYGKLRVLFVSRNAPEKRPEIFVKIARQCEGMDMPLDFIMVGDFMELRASVGSNVILEGEVFDRETLNDIYTDAHLILVTSWREGFPLVIMEGMGHGVVPIATKVGEIPTYISPTTHRNGFVVENNEDEDQIVAEFVQQIGTLCKDRALLEEFGKNAYTFAQQNFGEEKFKHSYRELLLGKSGPK